jgi:hypothetical protein
VRDFQMTLPIIKNNYTWGREGFLAGLPELNIVELLGR